MNNPFDINELMNKAQDLQEAMKKQTEESGNAEHRVTVGGDMVEMVVNGKQEVLSLKINPEVVDPEDVETLENLMCAAFNQAIVKTRDSHVESMNEIVGKIKFPGMP